MKEVQLNYGQSNLVTKSSSTKHVTEQTIKYWRVVSQLSLVVAHVTHSHSHSEQRHFLKASDWSVETTRHSNQYLINDQLLI